MRRFRAIIVFVLAAVILSAPLASAASIKPRVERSLLSSIGDFLAVLWLKEGCGIDPLGTKEGTWIDPLGGKQTEKLEEGCHIDPLGGCVSGR